jgi:hypothetical protein
MWKGLHRSLLSVWIPESGVRMSTDADAQEILTVAVAVTVPSGPVPETVITYVPPKYRLGRSTVSEGSAEDSVDPQSTF